MQPSAAELSQPAKGGAYGWYVVGLLTAAYLCAYVDRQILPLLVEPIKHDLSISDTQLGLMQGLAFGIFFTVAGAPLGYLADRVSRGLLLTASVLAWSVMTAACGLAGSYGQLLSARIGTSVGEAALGPTAAPLIRDIVGRSGFARAMSVYMLGIPVGGGLATLLGATLLPAFSRSAPLALPLFGALKPWQSTFFAVAAPGLIIGLLMLTVRDPRSSGRDARRPAPPLAETFAFCVRHWRAFVGFGLPGIAGTAAFFGVGFWIPAVFHRHFGLSPDAASAYLRVWGLMSLVLGTCGVLAGGALGDRVRKLRSDAYVLLAAAGLATSSLSYVVFGLASDPGLALLLLAPAALTGMVPPVMAAAAGVEMAPQRMRSLISALWSPLFTLIGVGFGPAIVAATAQLVFHSEAALPWAISLVVAVLASIALPLLIIVRGPYRAVVAEAETFGDNPSSPVSRAAHEF